MRQQVMVELDVPRIAAACEQRLTARCPRATELTVRTLARLTPDRWMLEWHLPWWLAASFGLAEELAAELVESNVLGLVAVRLEDDLLDDEVAASDLEAARRLSAAALDEALEVYRRRLPASSPFWPFLERMLTTWRRASGAAEAPDDLASLGAPLKVAAFATCLLAAREDAWPALERCLEHALSALVRYDQVSDWEADLAADRGNAFVTAIASGADGALVPRERRSRTLVALLSTNAVRGEYTRISADATTAALIAASLGCEPLSAFLASYAARATTEGDEVAAHYHGVARLATSLIFGNAPRHAT